MAPASHLYLHCTPSFRSPEVPLCRAPSLLAQDVEISFAIARVIWYLTLPRTSALSVAGPEKRHGTRLIAEITALTASITFYTKLKILIGFFEKNKNLYVLFCIYTFNPSRSPRLHTAGCFGLPHIADHVTLPHHFPTIPAILLMTKFILSNYTFSQAGVGIIPRSRWREMSWLEHTASETEP